MSQYVLLYNTSSGIITAYQEFTIDTLNNGDILGESTVKTLNDRIQDVSTILGKTYIKNDEIKQLPEKPSQFYVWNLKTESYVYSEDLYNQYLNKLKTEVLRKRNSLLLNSDWTELPSALTRLGGTKIAEWQSYRQALRDITSQSGYPTDVIWPEQPV